MRIFVAPNAFKGSLSALEVANVVEKGLLASGLSCRCLLFPIGDGGTGTGELIAQHCKGDFVSVDNIKDPIGRLICGGYYVINNGKTAVIDMSMASGIQLLKRDELNPCSASSFGTGQLVNAALDSGFSNIIICCGGSATVDGGAGALLALGVRFLDFLNEEILDLPKDLHRLSQIDTSALDARLNNVKVTLMCDVNNGLMGECGGIRMFAPQKGAKKESLDKLERDMLGFMKILANHRGIKWKDVAYGGAGGGISAGFYYCLGAEMVNGINFFLELTKARAYLSGIDLLITGEGSVDKQTLQGKAPFGIAKLAKQLGIPVICLTGMRPRIVPKTLNDYFDAIFAIGNEPMDIDSAICSTSDNLFETSKQIGSLFRLKGELSKS